MSKDGDWENENVHVYVIGNSTGMNAQPTHKNKEFKKRERGGEDERNESDNGNINQTIKRTRKQDEQTMGILIEERDRRLRRETDTKTG